MQASDAAAIGRGQVGEGNEVAVQEREPIIVIPNVQRRPQAPWQLRDEAKGAAVAAGAKAIEHVLGEAETQVLVYRFLDLRPAALTGAVLQHQPDSGLGREVTVLDVIPRRSAIDSHQPLAGQDAGLCPRAVGLDRLDDGRPQSVCTRPMRARPPHYGSHRPGAASPSSRRRATTCSITHSGVEAPAVTPTRSTCANQLGSSSCAVSM